MTPRDQIHQKGPCYDAAVLSGGGSNCMCFAGALEWLAETGRDAGIRTYIGCSGGAMCCLLAVLGMTPKEMVATIQGRFCDMGCHAVDVEGIFDILDTWGIDDGSRLVSFIRAVIRERIAGGADDVTFKDVEKVCGRRLVVVATNVTEGKAEFFCSETTPYMSVVTAVRMSMAVPLVFAPVKFHGCIYADGALLQNLPLYYHRAIGLPPPSNVIAVEVIPSSDPTNFFGYLRAVTEVVVGHANASSHHHASATAKNEKETEVHHVRVPIDDANMGLRLDSMQFDLTPERVQHLVNAGYEAAARSISPQ